MIKKSKKIFFCVRVSACARARAKKNFDQKIKKYIFFEFFDQKIEKKIFLTKKSKFFFSFLTKKIKKKKLFFDGPWPALLTVTGQIFLKSLVKNRKK